MRPKILHLRQAVPLLVVTVSCSALADEVTPRAMTIHPFIVAGKIYPAASYGSVQGLKKGGDGFLSVRAAPSVKARELDRLKNGRSVIIYSGDTEARKNGFIGVVYPADETFKGEFDTMCEIPDPSYEGPYLGPCRSGWVSDRYAGVDAG
ncbi:hypothetical protein [Rhizobium sp. C4]|uniref:hypothetical protein n=1 Tax=Rhizobium sp. C4 TaxID=1349800 RepID=UPI001E385B19|nr:hypothetical protein [Rhizobium sp. C4]MCD2175300.1 hypothetical protein [Rhizobium sp. C4]